MSEAALSTSRESDIPPSAPANDPISRTSRIAVVRALAQVVMAVLSRGPFSNRSRRELKMMIHVLWLGA